MDTTDTSPGTAAPVLSDEATDARYSKISDPYPERLKRALTAAEFIALGSQIDAKLDLSDQLVAEEARLAGEKKNVVSRRELLDQEVRSLSQTRREGKVYDEVQVRDYHDVHRLTVMTMRLDTFEIVSERPMDDNEREDARNPTLPGTAPARKSKRGTKDIELVTEQTPTGSVTRAIPLVEPAPNSPEDLGYTRPDRETAEQLLDDHGRKNGNGHSKRKNGKR